MINNDYNNATSEEKKDIYYNALIDNHLATAESIDLVLMINGSSLETYKEILYCLTGYEEIINYFEEEIGEYLQKGIIKKMTFTNNYKLKEKQEYYYFLEIKQKFITLKLGFNKKLQMKRELKRFNRFYKNRDATLKYGKIKVY